MNIKIILMFAVLTKLGNSAPKKPVVLEDADFWINLGQQRLKEALNIQRNENVAKNVILFLGDGMSLPTVTAARILKGQKEGKTGEEGYLDFEKFPYSSLVKTYCVDYQVSDSSSTATALLTGVKTNKAVVGVDASVEYNNCSSLTEKASLSGMASWFQEKGKLTGIVTTARITHASPSSAYAHSPSRSWECDDDLDDDEKEMCPKFQDIARQLVENEPGSKFNVIMGGGLSYLDGDAVETPTDSEGGCLRKDGRVLWRDWLNTRDRNENSHFVRTRSELMELDMGDTENIMGIFDNDHLPYEYQRKRDGRDVPTLTEMVDAALTVVDKDNSEGFFLFVESAKIDHGHHGNRAQVALDETLEFSNAITHAVDRVNLEETLIVVTADHSHTMSIAGYPRRGNDILGVGGEDDNDIGYTTLQYINGKSYEFYVEDGEVTRPDPRDEDLTDTSYRYQAKDPLSVESHGGDDVPLYAIGPMAHIFQGVMEQNYVAHAMAYASCVGLNLDHCSK